MTTARDEILARVRYATPGRVPPIPRTYRREGNGAELVERFCDRVADYRADVRRATSESVSNEIASAVSSRGANRIAVPPGLPAAWRPPTTIIEDQGLSAAELDTLDGVVTGCEIAIAETGTIVLAGGSTDGRRALTLVPDLHVCIVQQEQIVDIVPEAISRLADLVRSERRPLTFVSGPSATSDIELSRVEGVHGPRDLVVIVLGET
jgi:L-lactate dehydrogenase complex protein LldG